MKVLIAGCGLAGLATAVGLVTKFEREHQKKDKNKKKKKDDDAAAAAAVVDDTIQIVIVERRWHFENRGATFGLAPNGQIALEEIAPTSVLEGLKEIGIHMAETSGGYMLPWWKVRDALLHLVQETSPYKDKISVHLGCVLDEVQDMGDEDDEDKPLKVSFQQVEQSSSSGSSNTETVDPLQSSTHLPPPQTQQFDLVIGADGVHSQVRTKVLNLPPPVSTDTMVWRGSVLVDEVAIPDLKHLQDNPVGKVVIFGENIILAYFNFHSKLPGTIAWVLSCRNAKKQRKAIRGAAGGGEGEEDSTSSNSTLTPMDMIGAYYESLSSDQQEAEEAKFQEAKLVFDHTNDPSDLTWSTEMAIVDLDSQSCRDTNRWGGRDRITLVGDAAHSLRPASGLGGSLAFEDAALLSRYVITGTGMKSSSDDVENKKKDEEDNKGDEGDTTPTSMAQRLADFEAQRLPRCQSLSRDQTLRSTLAYKLGFGKVHAWDPRYRDWVFQGLDASPHPPVDERDVFTSVLSEEEMQTDE